MTAVSRRDAAAPPRAVYAVLADGWSYAAWVVGASRVRDVDATWPAEGARIHHSIGGWPMMMDDETTVLASEADRSIELDVSVWLFGRGRVSLQLDPVGANRCSVVMREWMTGGPLSKLPPPVVDFVVHHRNNESLRRLVAIAEGYAGRSAVRGTEGSR
jgi:hypothetical protein